MIEKVNPCHPDKVADRIAGAIIDLAYKKSNCPKCAVEVLIGHGLCTIICESSEVFSNSEIDEIVKRISGAVTLKFVLVPQDKHLANNQKGKSRCGDNGIFKGVPLTGEEITLSRIARDIFAKYPSDGKYILADNRLIICQSNANREEIKVDYPGAEINPLGFWTGGCSVDSGATNRKLGSDMAQSVTGGGLHGKDLSKADVSVNIYAFLLAQKTQSPVQFVCAIGDESIDGRPYDEIMEIARDYIQQIGGFEKFAEWGLF